MGKWIRRTITVTIIETWTLPWVQECGVCDSTRHSQDSAHHSASAEEITRLSSSVNTAVVWISDPYADVEVDQSPEQV